ncbi:hypothetical protein ALC60_07640 [Trachymyrmex zeteki]|uniref:DUF1907 domain-containing protein n=1 Tax=Mycetomoellerius zeteki TaxID=64791 RepID=A0A151WZ90_9HYME|nr:hypothetical protein ALC60_07640 [Trachymyrmex zeteki]
MRSVGRCNLVGYEKSNLADLSSSHLFCDTLTFVGNPTHDNMPYRRQNVDIVITSLAGAVAPIVWPLPLKGDNADEVTKRSRDWDYRRTEAAGCKRESNDQSARGRESSRRDIDSSKSTVPAQMGAWTGGLASIARYQITSRYVVQREGEKCIMAERPNGDCYTTDDLPYIRIPLSAPIISEIAEVLQNGMQPLFHEVNVDVASCPCLTGAPYNLAGVGLCGNTSVMKYRRFITENLEERNHTTRNIRDILTTSCHDSFIIGSTYATKPSMPYYGHVRIINIFILLCPCGKTIMIICYDNISLLHNWQGNGRQQTVIIYESYHQITVILPLFCNPILLI